MAILHLVLIILIAESMMTIDANYGYLDEMISDVGNKAKNPKLFKLFIHCKTGHNEDDHSEPDSKLEKENICQQNFLKIATLVQPPTFHLQTVP
jgi:hypothetical protein